MVKSPFLSHLDDCTLVSDLIGITVDTTACSFMKDIQTPNKITYKYILIEVRDNGIGFKQEDAERIFNVFTRLHGNAEYGGTGVGLSIAQKIVENHGGYIWAESEPDKGSAFKVLLPAE